ncbi:MAG: hypothetical protein RLZ97_2647 [Verrucomicrobiota bacterium]|jgi:hypothetical protein
MEDFINSVIQNSASAAIWAVIGMIVLWIRNRRLERKLRLSIFQHAYTESEKGLGVSLSNPICNEIVIRQIRAVQKVGGSFVLKYDGPTQEIDPRGFIKLPGFCRGTWYIPISMLEWRSSDFTQIEVEFTYPTVFGYTKWVTISCKSWALDQINTKGTKNQPNNKGCCEG